MKIRTLLPLAGLLLAVFALGSAFGATTIVSDNYGVTTTTTGFALDNGVNYGINPPTTRMTGSAKANLRYLQTGTARSASKYGIASSRLRVQTENSIGRFTISANGSTAFDFGPALGTLYATPANPATYDVKISMRNDAATAARLSFGVATAEGDVGVLDFGIQVYRAVNTQDFYTIQKRIDAMSGTGTDINTPMMTMPDGSWKSMTNFLIRVWDAGAESGDNYNSRVQVWVENGTLLVYDTATDSALPNGFRFDGSGRVIVFDQAPNQSDNVFYDSFSISSDYAPPPPDGLVWTGGSTEDNYWSSADNWGGNTLASGSPLVFDGTARQVNTNDLADLAALSVTLNNGGFALYGNTFTNTLAITNLAGVSTLAADMEWGTTAGKTWTVASGSELVLANTTTVEVNGDHNLYGGGTLRQKGTMNIGVATTANPPFVVNEGVHIVDGGTFTSRGGYRIGSIAAAPAGAQTILTNGALFSITVAGGNIRVGDSANPVTSRLDIHNSTLTSAGSRLCIPYAAGATGEVAQVGGTFSGARISFSDSGAGMGTYTIKDGTLETYQIDEGTSAGNSRIYFDNAVLRVLSGSTNAFMSGLNWAEIQAGGLTIDTEAEVVIAQRLRGTGGLTKDDWATLTLTGNNDYTGNTVVNAGKLVLTTGRTYVAPIQVADYAELGVLVQSVGASLTSGGLSLGSSALATLSFDLGAYPNPTAPLMIATNLSANSVVNINVANGLELTTGQIVLVDYQGAIGGLGYDAFILANVPSGVTAQLSNNTANSSIDLIITGAPGLVWTGAASSDWDYGTQNWFSQQTATPSTYSDNQITFFWDGAATGVVNLGVYPYPSALIVSNDTLPYVWNGGAITTPLLKKNGPGSLTRTGGEADLITGLELNAGFYVFSNFYDATFATVLTDASAGTGTFVKRGPGLLTMSAGNANNTFHGTSVIQEGMVKLGDTRALGATSATIIITNGGTLDLVDHQPAQPVIVSGAGVNGEGAIIDSTTSGAVEANLQNVIMTGDTTLGCPNGGRWDLRVRSGTGPGPGLQGNGYNLTKVGSGLVSIACQRNLDAETPYWQMNLGDILVSEGNLAFAESLDFGNPSASLTVSPGAILQLYDLGITNPVLRTITMTDAQLNISGEAPDTNVVNGGFMLTGANFFWADEAHLIVNGPIGGSGSINFAGNNPGTLLLNATNTYTGETWVTNCTIGGNGVIAGNLNMLGGTNSPGMSVGTLTVNGAATLAGTTLMELDRTLSPNSDRLVVGGALTFGGILQVVLGAGAPAPQAGDVYQLFNKGSGTSFTAINLPDLSALPGDRSWDTSELQTAGTISVTGTASPSTIGTVSVGGGSFTLSGTGGIEGDTYYVLMSPNVAAPLASWTPVASNVFGPTGTFEFTTNTTTSGPKAFFRVVAP